MLTERVMRANSTPTKTVGNRYRGGALPGQVWFAQEYGLAPVKRIVDLVSGDLASIIGTPETDPVAVDAEVTYIGQDHAGTASTMLTAEFLGISSAAFIRKLPGPVTRVLAGIPGCAPSTRLRQR